MKLKREVKFFAGHDCINFECKFNKKSCVPNEGGSHGLHGLEIGFFVKGNKGAVQFKLSTGWLPQKVTENGIGYLEFDAMKFRDSFPMATDLGYHSYTPHYEGQEPISDKCELLGGKPCYYDGSSLNANNAFYTLLNGGDKALWNFLEEYYKYVFEGSEYPKVTEYPKNLRTNLQQGAKR